MFEEIVPEIVQVMIEYKKPMKISQISEQTGFEDGDILRTLNMLVKIGLFLSSGEKPNVATYEMVKQLKGIHLARAAQLGVNLSSFDNYFKIDKKEKKLALELASNAEKIKLIDVKNRKPLIQKRSYFQDNKMDDISENLMLLLEASNLNLYEYLEDLSKKDNFLKLLLTIHNQAESSWRDYIGDK
jgi:hypothetical protein